jgi:hypothetical protein
MYSDNLDRGLDTRLEFSVMGAAMFVYISQGQHCGVLINNQFHVTSLSIKRIFKGFAYCLINVTKILTSTIDFQTTLITSDRP